MCLFQRSLAKKLERSVLCKMWKPTQANFILLPGTFQSPLFFKKKGKSEILKSLEECCCLAPGSAQLGPAVQEVFRPAVQEVFRDVCTDVCFLIQIVCGCASPFIGVCIIHV